LGTIALLGVECGAQQPAARKRVVRLVAAVVADDERAAGGGCPSLSMEVANG
jgi:hypothetical protein